MARYLVVFLLVGFLSMAAAVAAVPGHPESNEETMEPEEKAKDSVVIEITDEDIPKDAKDRFEILLEELRKIDRTENLGL